MFNQNKSSTSKDNSNSVHSFELLILILVMGWLILAIMDAQYRASFVKIAEFGIGCFLGWMLPRPIKSKI